MNRTALRLSDSRDLRFVAHRPQVRDLLTARIRAASIDGQLARGVSPDDGRARSARAAYLVAPRRRTALAGHWLAVIDRAERRSGIRDPRVPVPAARVGAVRHQIRELAEALRAPLPVPVRGVAMALLLLTDSSGPLYARGGTARELAEAIAAAVHHLDPATELMAR